MDKAELTAEQARAEWDKQSAGDPAQMPDANEAGAADLAQAQEEGGQESETSGAEETAPGGDSESAEGEQPAGQHANILDENQQIVMHRISQAIAMLVYGKDTNRPIVEMATQGEDGLIAAVQQVLDKVASNTKPGIPRDLLPMAGLAALIIIMAFLDDLGKPAQVDMKTFMPKIISALADQFKATPIERAQLVRLGKKNARGVDRGIVAQNMEA